MRLFLRSAGFFNLRRTLASNASIPPRRRPIAPSSAFVRVHAQPRPFQALRSCRLEVVTEGLCTRRARVPETGDRGLRRSPSTLRTCSLKGRIVHFGPAGRMADSRDASHTMTRILEASRGASYMRARLLSRHSSGGCCCRVSPRFLQEFEFGQMDLPTSRHFPRPPIQHSRYLKVALF